MIGIEDPQKLYEKLEIAKRQLKNAKTKEEKIAITNYIGNLYDSIRLVSPTTILPSYKSIYGKTKDRRVFYEKLDEYEDKMIRNYISNKDFHNSFFEKIYKKTTHEIREIEEDEYSGITTLSEDDFFSIFFEFMNKMGLAKYFDKYVRGERIYTTKINYSDINTLGYTLYNPITKDSDIFIRELEYNIFSMYTLAHEFGHVYDLNNFDERISAYNRYFYQSFNGETISKTFERLFVDFLIENNILLPEAKDQLFDMTNFNYEGIVATYIVSLIPDIYLIDSSHLDLSPTKLYKLIERYFSKKNNIRKFINKCDNLEIHDTNIYAYGDIFSMFLKEKIKDNDYGLDVLDEFFEFRSEMFNPDTLEKLRITPEKYVKLYKKDIDLLKK